MRRAIVVFFYLIVKNNGGEDCDPLKKPDILQIVDGMTIISAEEQAFRQKAYGMLSSEFRAQLDKYR